MKKYVLSIAALLLFATGFAAPKELMTKDSTWRFGGYAGFAISQTALYQWAPGGSNSFSFLLGANAFAKMKKGKHVFDSNLDMKWGMMAIGLIRTNALASKNFQKNIDLIQFNSLYGFEVTPELYVGARLGFESQFTRTYDYSQTNDTLYNPRTGKKPTKYTVSKFGAPAYLTLGPGLTWKPKKWLTLFFSPVEGKMTFVSPDHNAKDTSNLANYYNDVDETRFGLKEGSVFLPQLGAELDILFQKDIVKNVNWKSHLNVFMSYYNKDYPPTLQRPVYDEVNKTVTAQDVAISSATQYIPTVRWENDIVVQVWKVISVTLSTRFVYQYNITVPIDKFNNKTFEKGPDGATDITTDTNKSVSDFNKLQIFEQFGAGITYKF